MAAQVYVEEWRIGDWGTPIELGQAVSLWTHEPGPYMRRALSTELGAARTAEVTHKIAEDDDSSVQNIRGRVTGIDALWVSYSLGDSGEPISGSGILRPVRRAILNGDLGADGRRLVGYLIDVDDTTDQDQPRS